MKNTAIIAALALALGAAPILAQDTAGTQGETTPTQTTATAAPAAEATPAEPDPGEEIICRRDRATGSLTRVNRVCKTRNEWNNVHANTRDSINDMSRNASGGSACRQDQMGGC